MQIPDYELLQKCGHGAYGEVWIARTRSGQLVALKTVERSEQIEKEFTGLNHYARIGDSPHLIRILHIGEVGSILYYTMELADNLGTEADYVPATLSNILKQKGRFTADETLELGRMLLEGLNVLHAARLVHRDIKPENILYVNGVPKLSDIGLVRSISQTLTLGGTLGFIPPERLRAGSTGKGHADDLYALGKVLYCCLTGNSVDLFPSFPQELIDHKPYQYLNQVISTACSPNRFHRFKNADEFQRALIGGVPHRKRFLSLIFRSRYVVIALLILTGFVAVWFIRPSGDKSPLKIGEIAKRDRLDFIAYGNGLLYIPKSGDILHQKHQAYQLDNAPRRQQLVFSDDFSSKKNWNTADSANFTFFDKSLIVGSYGQIQLKKPLESPYVIRFNLDNSGLSGSVYFRVTALGRRGNERAFYQWALSRKADDKLTVSPLEYQQESGQKISLQPLKQPDQAKDFIRVEMVQTENFFHLYIDGKLLIYVPSLFFGGTFGIAVDNQASPDYCRIKDFQIFSIKHDPSCPPEAQYRLPGQIVPKKEASPPVMAITRERLSYLADRYTSAVMAKVFGTDEQTIRRHLDEYGLEARRLNPPGSGTRQPRTRLTDREIANLRKTLSEL